MNSALPVLELKSVNNTALNVLNEHQPWCPWISTLPTYLISRAKEGDKAKAAKVTTIDQTDSPGWETLLLHMSTTATPGNAWLAVHSMLEDCVSARV